METIKSQLQIEPSRYTYIGTVIICIVFAVFSFFDLGPFFRSIGEVTYAIFLPATTLTELLVRVSESPISYISLPIFVIIESFVICYFPTLIVRVTRLAPSFRESHD
ncbi:MAG: hypothetical protein ACOYUK_05445 [Patescibacteria group bacterium]